jgi:microcystin-dependent protein
MDYYLGDIRIVAMNFAPKGWALCNGQILPVQQNQALFSLLGTFYGGNGTTTFALPNLQGRVSLGVGRNPNSGITYAQGQMAGTQNVTLLPSQLPAHNHFFAANNAPGTTTAPAGTYFADSVAPDLDFSNAGLNTVMAPGALSATGSSAPLPIQQPYLGLTFIIATTGMYPSRN